nr:uncharacterized protein LOC103409277 [Malus domestica]
MSAEIKFMWKAPWRAKVPGKVKICVRRVCLAALPTRVNLKIRKVLMDDGCVFCGNEPESVEHVLLHCPHAKTIWSYNRLGSQALQQGEIGVQDWLDRLASNLSRESFDLVLVLLWNIWKARNELFWNGVVTPPQEIPIKASTWLLEFKKWNMVQPKTKSDGVQKWRKPEEGWFKCSFDGVWDEHGMPLGSLLLQRQ